MNQLTAIDLSFIIIAYLNEKGDPVTNKKLQKLLYFTNAWHLAYFDYSLIKDEESQAWRFGPVYTTSYHKFKAAKFEPINLKKHYKKFKDSPKELYNYFFSENKINNDQQNLIKTILFKYSGFSAYELEVISHNDPPWIQSRKGCGEFENCTNSISNKVISQAYKSKLPS